MAFVNWRSHVHRLFSLPHAGRRHAMAQARRRHRYGARHGRRCRPCRRHPDAGPGAAPGANPFSCACRPRCDGIGRTGHGGRRRPAARPHPQARHQQPARQRRRSIQPDARLHDHALHRRDAGVHARGQAQGPAPDATSARPGSPRPGAAWRLPTCSATPPWPGWTVSTRSACATCW